MRGLLRPAALIPFMIAAVSLTGALVTWRASDVAEQANGLDAQVLRETTEVLQIRSQIEAVVAHDRRVFGAYQEHILAWRDLEQRASTADEAVARELRAQAQGRLAMARTLRPLFRATLPDFGDDAGTVAYDEDFARTVLTDGEPRLGELDPEETLALATARHDHAIALIAVVIMLVGSLFLLTVAQLGRRVVRLWFGGLGIAAAVVACATFILTEMGAS